MEDAERPQQEKIPPVCYHLADISEPAVIVLVSKQTAWSVARLSLTLRKLCFPSVCFRFSPKSSGFLGLV